VYVDQIQTLVRLANGTSVRYLPKWFPGASFLRLAEEHHKLEEVLQHKPFAEMKKHYVRLVGVDLVELILTLTS
jgi:hypothetical protein